jgi:palmitoyltransferase
MQSFVMHVYRFYPPLKFVEKAEWPGQQPARAQLSSTLDDTPGMSYELLSPKVDLSHNAPHDSDARTRRDGRDDSLQASPTFGNNDTVTPPATPPTAASQDMFNQPTLQHRSIDTPEEAHVSDVLANPETLRVLDPVVLPSNADSHQATLNLSPPTFSRHPPTKPVLLPENRYCSKDGIIKPPRAHHCRACGTVSGTFGDFNSFHIPRIVRS